MAGTALHWVPSRASGDRLTGPRTLYPIAPAHSTKRSTLLCPSHTVSENPTSHRDGGTVACLGHVRGLAGKARE